MRWGMTRRLLPCGVAAGLGILASIAAYQYASPAVGGWREIAWPFPRDGWPAGRAYHCSVASCGDEIDLYVRPKIGFCNCDSGVADDDEVDRVADLDLISERFFPLRPGKVVKVSDMAGRARNYSLFMPDGTWRPAIGIATSRRCDLMVAVATGKNASSGLQQKALDFLSSDPVTGWITTAMNGR
jgi:hypothetical protein